MHPQVMKTYPMVVATAEYSRSKVEDPGETSPGSASYTRSKVEAPGETSYASTTRDAPPSLPDELQPTEA